jgi:hypothetical protein
MKIPRSYLILSGFLRIIEGLCVVLTLAFWHPDLSTRLIGWATGKVFKKQIEEKGRNG